MKTRIDKERQFWDACANKHDNFIEKRAEESYDSLLKMFAEDTRRSKKLLETATGTGLISLRLCKQVPAITATDLLPEMIKIAKTKAEKQSADNVHFDMQDVCNLSFPGKSFDTIIASNVLHLLFKPGLALLEMKRVFTNKEKIIIPAYCHGQHLLSNCISRVMGFSGFKARSRWSEKSVKSFVEKNGLKIVKSIRLKGIIPLVYAVATPAINN